MEEISSLVYKISAIAAFALLITGLCYFITYKRRVNVYENKKEKYLKPKINYNSKL